MHDTLSEGNRNHNKKMKSTCSFSVYRNFLCSSLLLLPSRVSRNRKAAWCALCQRLVPRQPVASSRCWVAPSSNMCHLHQVVVLDTGTCYSSMRSSPCIDSQQLSMNRSCRVTLSSSSCHLHRGAVLGICNCYGSIVSSPYIDSQQPSQSLLSKTVVQFTPIEGSCQILLPATAVYSQSVAFPGY